MDSVLRYYSTPHNQPIEIEGPWEETPLPRTQEGEVNHSPIVQPETSSPQEDYIEIKVKQGDVLEKIARAYGTTVGAIKKANQLENERLSIGQLLRIPAKKKNADIASTTVNAPKETEPRTRQESRQEAGRTNGNSENEPVYYVVKSGDSPWKIAKSCGVKYEDILRLNQLNEERARNLKIGEKIRIK